MSLTEKDTQKVQQTAASSSFSVLFVCTHNVLRSPLAEALFQAVLKDLDSEWRNWKVDSAGTWVEATDRAVPVYRSLLAKRGIQYVPHTPQMITPSIINHHRLILTMEKGHKEALQIENPSLAGRIFLLSEMVGLDISIPDPAKEHRPDYEQLADLFETWLRQGFTMIRALANEPGRANRSGNEITIESEQ